MSFLRLRKKNDDGFTLIEILVVLVILGIILVMSISFYEASLEKSKSRACETNKRVIEQAKISCYLDNQNIYFKKELNYEDLAGYLREKPICPFGGKYNYGTIEKETRCSHENLNLKDGTVDNINNQEIESEKGKPSTLEKIKKRIITTVVIVVILIIVRIFFFPNHFQINSLKK